MGVAFKAAEIPFGFSDADASMWTVLDVSVTAHIISPILIMRQTRFLRFINDGIFSRRSSPVQLVPFMLSLVHHVVFVSVVAGKKRLASVCWKEKNGML